MCCVLIKDVMSSLSLTCAVQQLRDFPRTGAPGPGGDHGEKATGGSVRVGASGRPLCPGARRRAQTGGHVLHNEGRLQQRKLHQFSTYLV